MSESTPPSDAFLHQLLRFAPTAKMFYSGTLCGVSPDIDGLTQGCLHLLSRGELLVHRPQLEPLRVHAPSVVLLPRPLEHRVEGVQCVHRSGRGRGGARVAAHDARPGEARRERWQRLALRLGVPLLPLTTQEELVEQLRNLLEQHQPGYAK